MRIKEMIDQDIEIQRTAYQTSGSPGNSETGKGDSAQRDGKKPPQFLIKKTAGMNFQTRSSTTKRCQGYFFGL